VNPAVPARAAPRVLWLGAQAPGPALGAALHDHGYTVLHLAVLPRRGTPTARLRHDACVLVLDDDAIDAAIAAVHDARSALAPPRLLLVLPQLAPVAEVRLLDAGADAVVDAAQGPLLLLARLRRWLRDAPPAVDTTTALQLGALEIDRRACRVRVAGRTLALNASAAALMHDLAARDGGAATRRELAYCLGPAGQGRRSRTVDMAICRLRRSLDEQGVREVAIESVRGRGYRLVLRRRQ
jgi:two-component system phosphate regulon response regulator OmpR